MKKTIIIMPVANEQDTMEQIIKEIMALPYENLYLYPVIDSYSKDKTEQIIRSYEDTGRVKCIFYEKSTGVISCYFEGYRQALRDGAEFVIEMDGGGSHKPKEIPQFIDKLNEGYDCVWGARFIAGGGTLLSNLVLHTKLKDMTSGFEAFRADVLDKFDFDKFLSKGHMYQTEMRYYCRNNHTVEVPIHYTAGKSSLRFKSVTEALSILFKLKKNEKFVYKDSDHE